MLALNYNRTQYQGLFGEVVGNDMVKVFPDHLNIVLSKTVMHWLSVYGENKVVVYIIQMNSPGIHSTYRMELPERVCPNL